MILIKYRTQCLTILRNGQKFHNIAQKGMILSTARET
jgi:hypothetical protein